MFSRYAGHEVDCAETELVDRQTYLGQTDDFFLDIGYACVPRVSTRLCSRSSGKAIPLFSAVALMMEVTRWTDPKLACDFRSSAPTSAK